MDDIEVQDAFADEVHETSLKTDVYVFNEYLVCSDDKDVEMCVRNMFGERFMHQRQHRYMSAQTFVTEMARIIAGGHQNGKVYRFVILA